MIESVLKLVGRRRTFDTEAEQAAYVQGYNDACDSAAGVAYGLASLRRIVTRDSAMVARRCGAQRPKTSVPVLAPRARS